MFVSRRAGNGVNKTERIQLSDGSSLKGERGQQAQASSSSGGARAGASLTGSEVARDIGKGARAWVGSWRGRRCWREDRNHRGGLVADLSGGRASPLARLRAGAPLHLRVVPWRPVDGRTRRRARAMAEPLVRRGPRRTRSTTSPVAPAGVRLGLEQGGGALRPPRRWALWRLRRKASRPAPARRPRQPPACGSARSGSARRQSAR